MIDQAKETVKSYAHTAGQKANEATDAVIENQTVQAASHKVQDAAQAVASNDMVQAATHKVQEAAEAVAKNDLVQAVAHNDLVQAASRKVHEAAQVITENDLVQAVVHNVQDKAQKLVGQQDTEDKKEYKEVSDETNLLPTDKEEERGAANLKNDPAGGTGEAQRDEHADEKVVGKAIKHL